MPFYLGKKPAGDLVQFHCTGHPILHNTGRRFVSAIGPFTTPLGATYYARYGHANPQVHTCADAERLAREDLNPVWQMTREQLEIEMSMPAKELAEMRQFEIEEYEPDKFTLSAFDVTDMLRQSHSLEILYQE